MKDTTFIGLSIAITTMALLTLLVGMAFDSYYKDKYAKERETIEQIGNDE